MLRRSPMKPGTKPLKRTGFVNSSSRTELGKGALEKPRKPLKSRRPPQTKVRAAARGQDCTLLFPGFAMAVQIRRCYATATNSKTARAWA